MAPQPAALEHQARRLARLPEPPWLHQEVARRLADKLDAIRLKPTHWVDWAGVLGGGAQEVSRRYPEARRWMVEPTAELKARAQAAWQATSSRTAWLPWRKTVPPVMTPGEPPLSGWPADGAGLLWANMSLHTQADLDQTLRAWHEMLAVDGFLMCSGLGPDTLLELRRLYDELGWGRPTIQFVDMHDLGDALVKAGFGDPVMDMERVTLTWPDAPALLAELRTWGGNVAAGRFEGWRTPRWRDCLLDVLQTRLGKADGRLALTVELVYGHAVKPLPRLPVSGETRVSVSDMRRIIKSGPKPG